MQSIFDLLAFLSKEVTEEENPSTIGANVPSPTLSQVGTGGQAGAASTIASATQAPAGPSGEQKDPNEPTGHDRLYLSEIGGQAPEGYKGKVFTGRQGAAFIDARLLSPKMKAEMKPHDENKGTSYGGVIINENGEVLLRKPKDGFGGYEWTFAKGGANKNEDPLKAAIREVKEETGLDCEIVTDIPGHFTTGVNNKFFLMKVVGGETSLAQTNETSDVQFFNPSDAEAQIKLTGSEWDNHDGVQRDLAILKAAFHENGKHQKHTSKLDAMMQRLSQQKGGLTKWNINEGVDEIANHFFEHGELPEALTNPLHDDYSFYHPFREEILDRLANPTNKSNSINHWIAKLYNGKEMKEKWGVMDNGKSTMAEMKHQFAYWWARGYEDMKKEPTMVTEFIGEMNGSPQNYEYPDVLPFDIDLHGNKKFRSIEERNALAVAWKNWKKAVDANMEPQAKYQAKGKLPDRWDAEQQKMVPGEKYDFNIGGWELAGERADHVKKEREKGGIDNRIKQLLKKYGKEVPKIHSKETQEKAGERMVRDFVHRHQKLSTALLNMAYPKTDHLVLWRGSGGYQEVARPYDITGTRKMTLDDMYDLGMAKSVDETADGFEGYINTKPAAGWAFSPQGFGGDVHIGAEVAKEDIFMSSMDLQGYDSEMEWVVQNNPNMRAKIFHHGNKKGYIGTTDTWEYMDRVNGVSPEGVFRELPSSKKFGVSVQDEHGDTHTWDIGVKDHETDWKEEYGEAKKTSEMTGTAPGGVITGPDGAKYYVKHGREGQHVVESLANDIYRQAGIAVPETQLINYGGKVAHASKLVDNPETDPSGESLSNVADIQEGFFVDCLLGNHDFIGVGPENPHGNIVKSSDGRHYRIDNGGSMYLSGTGAQKNYGKATDMKAPLQELTGFRDPDINPRAAKAFESMSHETLHKAFENLTKLNNTTLARLVHESGIPPYKMQEMTEALISRRDNIVQHLVDSDELYDEDEEPMDFRGIEQRYALRKADTIYEDNPVGAPVTDLPVKEALEVLKKRPLLHFLDDLKQVDNDDDV